MEHPVLESPLHIPSTPAGLPPCCFPPGDLTGQLLDLVEEGVCCPPVQGLWAKQGHTLAGRAPSRLLPEDGKMRGRMESGAESWTSAVRRAGGSRNEEMALDSRPWSCRRWGWRCRTGQSREGVKELGPHRLLGSSQWKSTGQLLKSKL